jgi:hypothetical protein
MKTGDIVFATVNVINTRTAAIAGPITSVDPDKGTVTVATASGPFTFRVVPEKLREMRPGDPLVLKLEVVDIGPRGGEAASQQPEDAVARKATPRVRLKKGTESAIESECFRKP